MNVGSEYNEKMRFLFWNAHKNPRNIDLVTQYGAESHIDVIALCESGDVDASGWHGYEKVKHIKMQDDINVFSKNLHVFYTRERQRYCILRIEGALRVNIAVVHLNSDLRSSGHTYREADIDTLHKDLAVEEIKNGKNTLIIGDFNENLFSNTLFGWSGFNVKIFKSSIVESSTKIHESEKDIYYNPMINVYKDNDSECVPKGTYYYRGDNIQWLCYDQIMMKQPLIDRFNLSSLRIVDVMCGINLVRNHKPDPEISDHMPIYFEFTKER